jgi:CRISPR type III-B/RAMP module RAMP protein Cmr6
VPGDGGAVESLARWPHRESEQGIAVASALGSTTIAHPGLVFAKFLGPVARAAFEKEDARHRQGKRRQPPSYKEAKHPTLKDVAARFERWAKAEEDLLVAVSSRTLAAAQSLNGSPGTELIRVEAKLQWRLTSRLGEPHPLESGFMFHPLFGVPYLPGSGFKGAVRFAYWARYVAPEGEKTAERAKETMRMLFGSDDEDDEAKHRRGAAVFFDVFPPARNTRLAVDVLNPHFKDWYEDRSDESDDQSPVPNFFLAVTSQDPWQFLVVAPRCGGGRKQADQGEAHVKDGLTCLRQSIEDCLSLWGIGAKTAAGYGLFATESTTTRTAGTATTEMARGTPSAAPSADSLRGRFETFKPAEFSQLRQLLEQAEGRPDRDDLLRVLAGRMKQVCERRMLRKIQENYPDLAPFLRENRA